MACLHAHSVFLTASAALLHLCLHRCAAAVAAYLGRPRVMA